MKGISEMKNDKQRNMWKGNDIGPEGARLISDGLKNNSTLTSINLSSNQRKIIGGGEEW